MLRKLTLKNFGAFTETSVEFSSRVNVILGENSSGKTQLLKAAYVLSTVGTAIGEEKTTKAMVEQVLTEKLLRTYKPAGDKLGELYNRGGKGNAEITADFASDGQLGARFTSRSKKVQVTGDYKSPFNRGAVYIPAKEVLSFLDGISNEASDSDTLGRLFDSTFFDLIEMLLEQQREEVEEKTRWFREEIINELGGQFVFDEAAVRFKEGTYKEYKGRHASKSYFSPSSKSGLSAAMTAEGYRKIGVLQRLLENQAIGTGVNGPLLWDEPESNMNPALTKLLVKILFEISRNGQQIILATHDYVLLKWFDLLMDKGKEDHVRYHLLNRDIDSNTIEVESTDDYSAISKSAISNAFAELYDEDVKRALG